MTQKISSVTMTALVDEMGKIKEAKAKALKHMVKKWTYTPGKLSKPVASSRSGGTVQSYQHSELTPSFSARGIGKSLS